MSKKRACWSTGASPQARDERKAKGGSVTKEVARNNDIKQWVTEKSDKEDEDKIDDEIHFINS